jgi:hypothetical protein
MFYQSDWILNFAIAIFFLACLLLTVKGNSASGAALDSGTVIQIANYFAVHLNLPDIQNYHLQTFPILSFIFGVAIRFGISTSGLHSIQLFFAISSLVNLNFIAKHFMISEKSRLLLLLGLALNPYLASSSINFTSETLSVALTLALFRIRISRTTLSPVYLLKVALIALLMIGTRQTAFLTIIFWVISESQYRSRRLLIGLMGALVPSFLFAVYMFIYFEYSFAPRSQLAVQPLNFPNLVNIFILVVLYSLFSFQKIFMSLLNIHALSFISLLSLLILIFDHNLALQMTKAEIHDLHLPTILLIPKMCAFVIFPICIYFFCFEITKKFKAIDLTSVSWILSVFTISVYHNLYLRYIIIPFQIGIWVEMFLRKEERNRNRPAMLILLLNLILVVTI